MNLRHSFLCSVAVVASAYVGVGEAQAAERTATFTSGAVARYTNAPNGTDSAKLFSELSITSVIITQTINDPTQSSWLQGNDTTVNVTVKRSGGLPDLIITGATMNWVSNSCTPNGCDYIGLTLPGPVNDGYPALPQGYSKTYILQFGTSTLNLAGLLPDNIDGSANFGNNAFNALDAFYPIDSTAPTISAQTFSYAENKVAGATLATVSATDNTGVTAYRFSATGTNTSANGYYVIDNSGKIALTTAGAAAGVASNDFETTPNQFVLGVQAGDAAGNWSTASNVTLNVTDLDDTAPAIAAGQTFNYVENQTAGAQVGAVAATDAVGVTAFRFSDTGTTTSADGYYQIDSTGKITLTAAGAAAGVATNDFETTPNQFIYGIQAGDAAGNWSAATNVTLNVTDGDDTAPAVTAGQTFNYVENQTAGAQVGTVAATDAVGVTAFRFSANNSTTSADGYYQIDSTGKITLTAAGAAAGVATNDFETTPNQFIYGIQAGDAAGNWSAATNVTLNVTDGDDTAPAVTAGQTFNYVENQTAGAQVGTVAATDAVGVTAFRFSANNSTTSADGYYQIDSTGKITLTAAGAAAGVATNDFETTPNQFIYGIQAGDAAGNWSAATNVTLNVTDLDDTAPVVAAGQTFSYAENQAAGAQVGAVSATDAGGVTAFRFSANNSTTSADGYFQIDATGKITLTAAGAAAGAATNDFETAPNQFTYGIQAGDAQGLWSAVTNVTLKVTDVNEDSVAFNGATPVDGVPTYTYQYKEKSAEGATLGTVSATGAITSPTFTIVGGNTDGWYQINSSTGAISLTAAGVTSLANDFSRLANTRTLQVQATSGTATATVNVVLIETDATGPVISGPAGTNLASEITVDENQIAVLTLGADEIAEWTIVGGDDQLLFNIDPTTGAITFKSAPDYERPADANGDNVYTFQVQAKDAAGNVTVQTITVRVLDLNAAFTGTNATNGGTASYAFDYNEKSAAGTTLGTVGATGPGTEVYTIESGNDNGWFAINSSTGVITLTEAGAASVANDYLKADNLHTLQVKVTSGPESAVIAVALNELDNAGPLITGPTGGEGAPESAVTVDENQVNVWTLTANEPVTEWKIIGSDDDAAFTIDANGKITFLAPPNYEKPTDKDGNNTYILTVQAKDAAGNVSTQKVTVTIRDLNDAPVFTNTVKDANGNAIYSFDYKERTAKDVELNRVSATGSGPLTFAITGGNDNGWYAINSSTGVITLTAAGAASLANDWETLANSQTLTVTAANTFGDTTAIKVLLNELDIDDTAPLITGPSGGPGAAASAITINEGLTAVTKMTANEPIKTWEISGGPDASKLTIAADGTITFKEAPDFENPTDADKNNTYVIIIRAVDMFGNESFQTLTITIGNVDEIAQKLREIGGKLRSDLRNYAFKSMQDMLSFNEGLMQGSSDDDADCSAAARQKAMSGSVNANQDQQALTLNYAKQLNACGSRIRVLLDMGLASSRMEGNTTLRTLASIRAERNIAENVTVGLGVMGSFASDRLNSFADSHISDESFQLNGYIRSRLSEALRVAAFASVGQAKYKFRLNDDGFAMTGRMTGDRLAYGMMLTGDFALAGMTVTTDVALSRASESLGNAKLAARYKGESRSGIAFGVGSVDATRLSVPVHFPLLGRKTSNSKTEGTQLSFSPGLLCEDTSADTSRLICGYQLGGRYRQTLSANDRLTFDVKHEKVEGNQRNLFALGFSHLFGPLELGVALNQEMSRYAADTRALLTVRVTGR